MTSIRTYRRLATVLWGPAILLGISSGMAAGAAAGGDGNGEQPKAVLAVCADPSNLPNSDDKARGFENKIASLLADDLHADLRYTWNLQRRSFFRHTLLAKACDVVIVVPADLGIVATTRPYFTSSYVFVTRRSEALHITSFDAPELRTARIGLQMLGAEGSNPPPGAALANRGITDRITGFPMWAEEGVENPQGKIIDAVAAGDIDVAIVWGPFAGYFAKPYGDKLTIEPVSDDPKTPGLPFTYAMALGVRKDDLALRDRLQSALDRHKPEIDGILRDYGVPTAAPVTPAPPAGHL